MKTPHPRLSLLLCAALACAVAVCAGCAEEVVPAAPTTAAGSPLVEEGALTVSSSFSHKPFESVSSWDPAGFSVDITREVARRMGLDCSFRTVNTGEDALDDVRGGSADMALDCFTASSLVKAADIGASDPYTTFDCSVVTMIDHDIPSIDALTALPEANVGIVGGSVGESWAREHLPSSTFTAFETSADAFSELQSGGIDAIVVDTPSANRTVHTILSNAVIIADADAETDYVYAVSAANPALKNEVNATLKQMKDDGTYQRIYDEWFEVVPPSHDSVDARVPEQDQQGFAK